VWAGIVMAGAMAARGGSADLAERLAVADQQERGGDYAAAEKVLVEALRELDTSPEGELARGVIMNNLGSIYHCLDQDAKAESCYRRSIEIHERILGVDHRRTLRAYLNLALHYVETGQPASAKRLGLKSLIERHDSLPGIDADRARLLNVIGVMKKLEGNYTEAEKYCRETLAIWNRLDPEGAETMRALNNLGIVYLESGRAPEGFASYQRALAIGEKVLGPTHPVLITLIANTGAAVFLAKGPAEAEPYYRRALDIGETTLGPQHSLIAKIMLHYAAILERMNRKAEAKAIRQKARATMAAARTTAPGRHTIEYRTLVEGR
jgi:tetratricopeptide (TPR) repeat protein